MLTFERGFHLSLTFDLIEMQAAGAHISFHQITPLWIMDGNRKYFISRWKVKVKSDMCTYTNFFHQLTLLWIMESISSAGEKWKWKVKGAHTTFFFSPTNTTLDNGWQPKVFHRQVKSEKWKEHIHQFIFTN